MWPPIWVGKGASGKVAQGEIGYFNEVRCNPNKPGRIFLRIDYQGEQYTGCLWLDDAVLGDKLCSLLMACCGMSIKAIGNLEVPASFERALRNTETCFDVPVLSQPDHSAVQPQFQQRL